MRSQSETCVGSHRLVDDRAEIRAERVQVDLVPEPRREGLERGSRVVAAPVETPVHDPLDPATGRPEERSRDERRAGDGEVVAACQRAEDLLERDHDPEVEAGEQSCEGSVDERTADDDVQVVEVVAQDRYAGGYRQAGKP